jgi:muramoyltetrapeptide carboxypeptidase
MIKKMSFPLPLTKDDTIGVTAPSSGVQEELHHILNKAKMNVEKQGYNVIFGNCLLNQKRCVSAPKEERAAELVSFQNITFLSYMT